ncbi:HD family hydrolase [Haematospirillum jordaniae]|uniref:HD family hydrolase n=1 Tax=Haematospirillum jordaniae TaxID=1549855 RepID=UPI001433420B|nr:HD family hydrolase [Haematospirillum jordaniae]NKD85883.1 HD family hydrolase [Haematospirillum jordaniae]
MSGDIARHLSGHAPRTWQRMVSGRRLNLVDPSPLDVEITDIALGLSRNSRWNGQTIGPHAWSVAQHSVFVVDIMKRFRPRPEPNLLLAGLLHDAPEYVTHDLVTPLKAVVGDVFREVENRLMCAIHVRFGLPPCLSTPDKTRIKKADLIAAATEAVQLAGFSLHEIRPVLSIKAKPAPWAHLQPLPATEAAHLFLDTFSELHKALQAS